jgi:hypothetical protein
MEHDLLYWTWLARPCIYCIYKNVWQGKGGEEKIDQKKLDSGQITADSYWQEADPTSPQRGRPKETRQQISDRINIWSRVPQWARHQDIPTDRPSVVTWLQLQMFAGLLARSQFASGRSCDRPSQSRFSLVPEQMLSWYHNSKLHCMLHMQPSQWQHYKFRLNVPLLISD